MNIILFLIALTLLILVHEWGHFYAARFFGVRVDEFGFGFPPTLWSRVKYGTKYAINLLPIGGYVKIYGEQGEGAGEKDSFSSQSIGRRFVIVAAGVIMNIFLAWILFSGAQVIGVPTVVLEGDGLAGASITVVDVQKGSPADAAGIRFGDIIQKIKIGEKETGVSTIEDLQALVKDNVGRNIMLDVSRNGTMREITVIPRLNPPKDSGPLGIALEYVRIIKTPLWKAPWAGLQSVYYGIINTVAGLFEALKTFFTTGQAPADISGPVGVFVFVGQIGGLGISYILQFLAVISLNLAILNSLPIPALDGGRILFMAIEKVRRRPIPVHFENTAHMLGFLVLILLMILVTIRDIHRFF